jgi:hypothetical protein
MVDAASGGQAPVTRWCARRRPAARRGAGLAGARVTGVQKLQESGIAPPPPPRVTGYQVQAKVCGRCGTVTAGQPHAGIAGRAQYGPEAHARAANLASAHHVPVGRAAQLMGDMTGLPVSAGWMAGVRHKAAVRLEPFLDHVRGLLVAPGRRDLRRRDPGPRRGRPGICQRRPHRVPHLHAHGRPVRR